MCVHKKLTSFVKLFLLYICTVNQRRYLLLCLGPAAVQFCRNSFSILKFDWAQVLLSLCSNLEHFLSNAYFISTKEVKIQSVLTKYFWSVTFTFSYKIVFKWSESKHVKDNNASQLCVTQIMYVTQFPNNQPLLCLHSDNCICKSYCE